MNIDKNKIYKGLAIIAALCVVVTCITQFTKHNSMTLSDYASMHPELSRKEEDNSLTDNTDLENNDTESDGEKTDSEDDMENAEVNENLQNESDAGSTSQLIGASLNGDSQITSRITYTDSFYYEPLSDNLRRYITGVSYPMAETEIADKSSDSQSDDVSATSTDLEISYEDLRYVHVLHYDFEGNPAEGELICNSYIAQDLVEIFYELYYNEYQIEKIKLIDEYDGNDDISMEDNNTSCFNYRTVAGSKNLSKHALGLAIDINPLYNPYITYEKDGNPNIAPASASAYADRERAFPYKIDENDLCYKLFIQHGFTWGGNWNSSKDYQHFQKTK